MTGLTDVAGDNKVAMRIVVVLASGRGRRGGRGRKDLDAQERTESYGKRENKRLFIHYCRDICSLPICAAQIYTILLP